MSTSVRLSAPADPGPNENPRKAIHWSRGKKATFFYGGVEGSRRLPFPFRILLNQGLMFISSFIKEAGAGAEWSARTIFILKSARWVDLGASEMCAGWSREESQRN